MAGLENSNNELDAFKTNINLSEYAASRGYLWDRLESSRNSVIMRQPTNHGDKLIITRDMDNHWIYFNIKDSNDRGSIVDFIKTRDNKNLGQIRQELRPWVGEHKPQITRNAYQKEVVAVPKDRAAVIQQFVNLSFLEDPSYLHERGIRQETLEHFRFAGMIKQDERKNIIFPHYDKQGLSGFEKKNRGFTGFSSGGDKAVWHSRITKADTTLVLGESAIDMLSYHQINPNPYARYVSLGGEWNDTQKNEILPSLLAKMPNGSTIVSAFDKDAGGEKFAQYVKEIAPAHLNVRRSTPDIGNDWNEMLKHKERNFIQEQNRFSKTPERVLQLELTKGQ